MPESLSWFSIIHNGNELIKFDKNNDLNVFNGIKCLAMLGVTFGHKFKYLFNTPIMYGKQIEMVIDIIFIS